MENAEAIRETLGRTLGEMLARGTVWRNEGFADRSRTDASRWLPFAREESSLWLVTAGDNDAKVVDLGPETDEVLRGELEPIPLSDWVTMKILDPALDTLIGDRMLPRRELDRLLGYAAHACPGVTDDFARFW